MYTETGIPACFGPLPSVLMLTLECASESPGGLVKTQIAGPHPE